MLAISFVVVMLIIVGVGAALIYSTGKINSLDNAARDKGSEIDTNLWDRSFRLGKIIEILDQKKIAHELEAPAIASFSLGMQPAMQELNAEKLDKMDRSLRQIIKENPELLKDEDFSTNHIKFNKARDEMFKNSMAYNRCVSEYNDFISKIPGNFFAAMYKKRSKPRFNYIFIELEDYII